MKSTIDKFVFIASLIVVLLCTSSNTAWSGGQPSCDAPDGCPTNTQCGNCRNIKRTFLKKKDSWVQKKRMSNKKNAGLNIAIDSTDIARLFAIGNQRVISATTNGLIVNIDVGDTSGNAQIWNMPDLEFIVLELIESVEPEDTPDSDFFDSSNLVYRGIDTTAQDTIHTYYEITDEEIFRHGDGHSNQGDPYLIDWFETSAFLPIEKDWQILETITTSWAFDPDIDSLIEHKDLITVSDGMLIPHNEDSVGAVLSCLIYDWDVYKDGLKIDSGGYEAMVWFSEEGHWIVGYLEPGAPLTGITQFEYVTYGKNIPACPDTHDFGTGLTPETYRAQNEIKSGAALIQGPIQFVAGQEVNLKNGFSASSELNLLIDPDPCIVEL